jgi:hypothetical protein
MRTGCTLRHRSRCRPQTIGRAKVSCVIGRADDETMLTVTRALAVFLDLA